MDYEFSHEYWMGYFGYMYYNIDRCDNPFRDNEQGQEFNDWDYGWWDSQMENNDF